MQTQPKESVCPLTSRLRCDSRGQSPARYPTDPIEKFRPTSLKAAAVSRMCVISEALRSARPTRSLRVNSVASFGRALEVTAEQDC